MMRNLFYFRHLNTIGGIEQFFAYLTEKYRDWDITIVYKTGEFEQVQRLSKYARVIKFSGETFYCEKAFFCFNTEIRNNVVANEYALVLHGDYGAMVEHGQLAKNCYIFDEPFDKYYGVSQTVCDSWTNLTGKPCELVYNPFVKYPTKNLLRLVYCGRLTDEKGGDLLQKLLTALENRAVDFLLYVYSNKQPFENDHIVYMNTRLDAGQFLNPHNFDFIIVPSKNEGYCYSLVQALSNGLPAVISPCPVFAEIGADKTNSILLNFDGSNTNDVIDQMLTKRFNFVYTAPVDFWDKYLVPGSPADVNKPVRIVANRDYIDAQYGVKISAGEVYYVPKERAEHIVGNNFANYTNGEEM